MTDGLAAMSAVRLRQPVAAVAGNAALRCHLDAEAEQSGVGIFLGFVSTAALADGFQKSAVNCVACHVAYDPQLLRCTTSIGKFRVQLYATSCSAMQSKVLILLTYAPLCHSVQWWDCRAQGQRQ